MIGADTYGRAELAMLYRARWRRLGNLAFPYLMFAPALILILGISVVPISYATVQSFFRSPTLALGRFVGLRNYADYLFTSNGIGSIVNSLIFVAGTVLIAMPLGFALAVLLSKPIPFRGFLRSVLIMPWLVSNLVGGLLWGWIGNPQYGLIPWLLAQIGIALPNTISNPVGAMGAVIVASAWSAFPLVMVFVLAAIQTVPTELREAAQIDGASAWQHFCHVTFPLVRNTTMVALILTSLHAFKSIDIVLVMTGGGPNGATETMAFRVFNQAFRLLNLGVGSTGAVMIFVINILFTLAFVRVLRTEHGV
jgi:multiple sugar transport system permease protein